jgi:hypothetical protein
MPEIDNDRLRELVFSSLDNARDNGYFNEGEYLHKATISEIALDMSGMSDDCCEYAADTLMPYIQAWMDRNPCQNQQ